MIRYYKHILCTLLLLLPSLLWSRSVVVSSAAAINSGTWSKGDTLILSGGTWTNQKITFRGKGTAAAPIVLQTSRVGSTVLTGSSTLTIDGSFLEVSGLLFEGKYTGTSAIVTFAKNSHHCRLTNTQIRSYNLSDATINTKWISINGEDHRVDHCAFEGKNNIGTLLVVWLTNGNQARHRIDHCQFGFRNAILDENGSEINGQEIIRIGDSSTSMTEAKCVVDSNYFAQCNGEIEIISNKSCGNEYRANTFYQCKGMLTLRHGNGCLVENNYFIGDNTEKSGGVRIIGENHTVRYNTMTNLTGTNYRAAICFVRGKSNSELFEYYPVINAQVYENIIVNCKQAFCLNYNSSSDCKVNATKSNIEDNQIYLDAAHKNNTIFNIANSIGDGIILSHNMANVAGTNKNITPTATQLNIDKKMVMPEVKPIATMSNTGPQDNSTTGIIYPRSTTTCHKNLINGQIIITITNEQENRNHVIGTVRQYGIMGECVDLWPRN